MVLPENYKEIYPCINTSGFTANIYANLDYTEAYKIYLKKFNYDEAKMHEFSLLCNPNIFVPMDILSLQSRDDFIGYKMAFDDGKPLSRLRDAHFSELIAASFDILDTLADVSDHHFLITDPNIDNITFSTTYKLVDTYSFLWAKKFSKDKIFERNLKKINVSILNGLLGFSFDRDIESYFRNYHSKYLEKIQALDSSKSDFLYLYLSMVQEATQEDSLKKVKQKLRYPYL